MADTSETQKSGYLDVKQSSKVKGRKLKAWRSRWVVVRKMTDLAASTQSVRIDLYPSDPTKVAARQGQGQGQADRVTFVLDQLSGVQWASSRTHPFAFELVELESVLVLSGATQEASEDWMAALRQMFFADSSVRDTDSYKVTVQPNKDSIRFELSGDYTLTISPEGVSLKVTVPLTYQHRQWQQMALTQRFLTMDNPDLDSKAHRRSSSYEGDSRPENSKNEGTGTCSLYMDRLPVTGKGLVKKEGEEGEEGEDEGDVVMVQEEVLSWRLSMLKRFDVDRKGSGQPLVFLFDCGPSSPTGEATFRFITEEAYSILASFRKSINMALERRKHLERYASTPDLRPPRARTISSVTGYQTLLAQSTRSHTVVEGMESASLEAARNGSFANRSWSMSSSSTTTPTSPTSTGGDSVTSGESGKSEAGRERGLRVLPVRQRISTVSMPSMGLLSSSPVRSSENFGRFTPPGGLSGSPKSHDPFGSSFVQQQQQQHNQQQQQQQQQQQSWQMQQFPAWAQEQVNPRGSPTLLPAYPLSPLPPVPPGSPLYPLLIETPQQQQLLQLWVQQQTPEQQQQLQLWVQQHQQQEPQQSAGPGGSPQVDRLRRNSSLPNDFFFAGGFDQVDNDVLLRQRTSSLTAERPFASGSFGSADSGVVTDPANPRKGSNSFGSTVSTESSRSVRKTSEGVGPIPETPPTNVVSSHPLSAVPGDEDKPGTSPDTALHVYQDLDSVKTEAYLASRRRSSCAFEMGMGRRRYSTGDVSHNSDYEELDVVKRAIASATNVLGQGVKPDMPPELPARPPSFFSQAGAKAQGHGRRGLAAAVGILEGLRSLSLRDSSRHDSSSQETLTPSNKHKDGSSGNGPLSRSSSIDIYDTIGDVDFQRPFRRSSSDITPVASHPDLRVLERLTNPRHVSVPVPAPVLRGGSVGRVVGGAGGGRGRGGGGGGSSGGFGGGAELSSTPQSLDLLSFSGGDERSVETSNKRALMDFFLNDAYFHSNPMVTGDLRNQEGVNVPTLSQASPACSRDQQPPAFPQPSTPGREGWADFSDFSDVTSPCSQSSSNPFSDSSSWARFTPPEDSALGKRVEGAEPVYIDMRTQRSQDSDASCEYVGSEDVNRDQAFVDFLVFQ